MLAKFSKHTAHQTSLRRRLFIALMLMIWVVVGFILAQAIITALLWVLVQLGVSFRSVNDAVLNSLFAMLTYAATIAIVIGVPWIVRHKITTWYELGIRRWPSWLDIVEAPLAAFVYLLISGALAFLAGHLTSYNANQAQDIGFTHLAGQWQYFVAFLTLVVMAPIAEEILFRGYLYGKIRKRLPFIATALLVSLTFAALHIPGFNDAGHLQLQWNVAVDVFALSLVLCTLRETTDNVWAGILLHALKNGLAFYFLFINPIMSTIGS